MFEPSCFGLRSKKTAEAKINLLKLANGNIQQEIELERHEKGKHEVKGELSFRCYFQEVFDFKLQFYDWRGQNLIAADDDGTSDPYIKFAVPR